MYRAAPCVLLGLCIALTALSAPTLEVKEPAKKSPSVDEIKKAIDDLGNKRFAVRDRAKKRLLEIGQPAEPFLQEALKNPDEEIASSAKGILDRFQWGLYPDTPKEVRDLIEQFRSGAPEERQEAIVGMLKLKDIPFDTIRKLLGKEDNAEMRESMLGRMYVQIHEAIPDLLARGKFDAVEQTFELLMDGSPSLIGPDYATFMYLRSKLDGAIAQFEKQRQQPNEPGQRAGEMLVYLYRCKGDWPAARKAAEQLNKPDLVDRVLWQSSDWKGLAAGGMQLNIGDLYGVDAAYDRLAGNRKGYEEKIESLKKAAEETDDPDVLRREADALLLNSRANDAITILTDKKRAMGLTFDLLCAQMKHKEAFALVDDARRPDTDPKERTEIEIRRARMLYLLGDKDSAEQLFGKIAEEVTKAQYYQQQPDQPQDPQVLEKGEEAAKKLIKAEARIGLVDKAREHAAMIILGKADHRRPFITSLFEPTFGDDKSVALAWFQLFRKEEPNGKATVAMNRVRDILTGKLDAEQFDKWLDKMAKQKPDEVRARNIQPVAGRTEYRQYDAMGAAYRAAGNEKKTEEYLTKAAEKYGTSDRWIKVGDYLLEKKRHKDAGAAYAKAAKQATGAQQIELADDDELQLVEQSSPALATYLQARAATLDGDAAAGKRLAELAHWLPLGNEIVRAALVDELSKRGWPEMARKEAAMLLKTGWWTHYSYGNVITFLARQASKDKQYLLAADYYEKCLVGCLRMRASFVESTAYLLVPESVRVYRSRGYLAAGKVDAALREANGNLNVMPGNIDLAIKLVPDLDRLGKKAEADAIYKKVRDAWLKLCKDYPNSAFAHNSAAWVMAICRRDLDDALKHSLKAVEIEPKSAGYMDTLAEIYFRKGDRQKALSLMKQCVEIEAKNKYFGNQLARFKSEPFDSPTPDEDEEDD